MNNSTSIFCLFGLLCAWPALWMFVAVKAYQRYTEGGWRAVFFGRQIAK